MDSERYAWFLRLDRDDWRGRGAGWGVGRGLWFVGGLGGGLVEFGRARRATRGIGGERGRRREGGDGRGGTGGGGREGGARIGLVIRLARAGRWLGGGGLGFDVVGGAGLAMVG